ncbi:MAG: SGNH/GDSL hydrolase family protein [Pseudomonadota bacterium]
MHLVLLGDSVLDNGVYVGEGEPSVSQQIQAALPGVSVEMRAIDGSMVADVVELLDRMPLPEAAPVVLSVGGNNALDKIDLLGDPVEDTFAQAMIRFHGMRERFRQDYVRLLERLGGRPLLAATVYNPNFQGDEVDLQIPAQGALTAFNDVIQQEVQARDGWMLELRGIFTAPSDYANPIEPSATGGAKLADAVATWFRKVCA